MTEPMHVVLLWVFGGSLWGAGEYQRGLSPSSKYTCKAHLDFPVQATEISFLKKHLEKKEGKAAQLFSKNKTQTFLPPAPCQHPFQLCDPQGPIGNWGPPQPERVGGSCPRSGGEPGQAAAWRERARLGPKHSRSSASCGTQAQEQCLFRSCFLFQEPHSWVQGQGPISKVGIFSFLLLDKEKWKKPMLLWPSAPFELILLPLAGFATGVQATNTSHGRENSQVI